MLFQFFSCQARKLCRTQRSARKQILSKWTEARCAETGRALCAGPRNVYHAYQHTRIYSPVFWLFSGMLGAVAVKHVLIAVYFSILLRIAAQCYAITREIKLFQNYCSLRGCRDGNNVVWNYFKIISEAYCSSWIFSNVFNVAEIIFEIISAAEIILK